MYEPLQEQAVLTLLQAFATLFVTVLDRNDNQPQFSQDLYTGSIMENSGPGTTIDMVGRKVEKGLFKRRRGLPALLILVLGTNVYI